MGDLNSGPNYQDAAFEMLTDSNGPFKNTSRAGDDEMGTHGSHWVDHVLGTKNDFTS